MKITMQEQEERKLKILRTAYQLFGESGINQVTMRDIAKASNVGTTSIFRYFSTKPNLLLAVKKLIWGEIQQKLSPQSSISGYQDKDGFGQICDILHAFEAFYYEHSQYILFAAQYKIYLVRHRFKIAGTVYDEMLLQTSNLFKSAVQKGIADGSVIAYGNVEDMFYTTWGILRSFVDELVVYDHMLDGRNEWRQRFPFVLSMILQSFNPAASQNIWLQTADTKQLSDK